MCVASFLLHLYLYTRYFIIARLLDEFILAFPINISRRNLFLFFKIIYN